jgi:hypothetical protein
MGHGERDGIQVELLVHDTNEHAAKTSSHEATLSPWQARATCEWEWPLKKKERSSVLYRQTPSNHARNRVIEREIQGRCSPILMRWHALMTPAGYFLTPRPKKKNVLRVRASPHIFRALGSHATTGPKIK